MVSFKDGHWAAVTPEGFFYNASPGADIHITVRIGNTVCGIEQYRDALFKPEMVEAALRPGGAEPSAADRAQTDTGG
jgi:hypothetical protein